MWRWVLLLSAVVAPASQALALPVACPSRSWCIPSGYCDSDYVIYDPRQPEGESYLCGGTAATVHYVCCHTQELLPNTFRPTLEHWHYQRRSSTSSDNLLVLPWHGHSEESRSVESDEDNVSEGDELAAEQAADAADLLVADIVEDEELEDREVKLRVVEDVEAGLEAPGVLEGLSSPQICPTRSICVHWSLCEVGSELYNIDESDAKDYLCGATSDSAASICCGTLLRLFPAKRAFGRSLDHSEEPEPLPLHPVALINYQDAIDALELSDTDPPSPMLEGFGHITAAQVLKLNRDVVPDPDLSAGEDTPTEQNPLAEQDPPADNLLAENSPADEDSPPEDSPELRQLPLDQLSAFSLFSPPPVAVTPAPDTERVQDHYLDRVLLPRERREVADVAPLGQVIYPSRIAQERLHAAKASEKERTAAELPAPFGGRLKPAAGGPVKLGGLSAGPPTTVSSREPDVRRELPTPALPMATETDALLPAFPVISPPTAHSMVTQAPFAIPVTPRSLQHPAESDAPDIRPLPVPMWRGDPVPGGRSSLSEEKEKTGEEPMQSVLGRILDNLPDVSGGVDPRHHRHGPPRVPLLPIPLHPPRGQRPLQPRPPFFQSPPHENAPHQPTAHVPDHQVHGKPEHVGSPFHIPGLPESGFHRPEHSEPSLGLPPHLGQSHPKPGRPERPFAKPGLPEKPHHAPGRPDHPHTKPGPPQRPHYTPSQPDRQHPPLAPRCGQGSELGLHARITSGRGERGEAGYGEYPWHVGVLAQDLTYLCAGVLVAARLVLTVAHCVAPRSPHETLVARVGDWDLAAADELYPAYDVDIFRIIVHPDYYAGNLQNDIALLVLDPPVEGLPQVQPACLPPPHAQFSPHACWVTGWGQARHVAGDRHDPSSYSWRLRETALHLVPPAECQHKLRSTQLGQFYQLPRRGALCAAGKEGEDSCFGDGGGALVCRLLADGTDGPFYVTGLVSWGLGCGQDIPAVYTKVSDYYDWILQHWREVEDLSLFQFARSERA